MRPWERRLFHLCVLLVSATGMAFFWMQYALVTDDPFAVINHPWQPAMLALHVLASPPLVLMLGVVFNSHVMKKLKATGLPNRKTGYLSLGLFALMAGSGYLLQVLTNEALVQAAVVAHVGSGAVFAVSYAMHLVISARLARRPLRRQLPYEAA